MGEGSQITCNGCARQYTLRQLNDFLGTKTTLPECCINTLGSIFQLFGTLYTGHRILFERAKGQQFWDSIAEQYATDPDPMKREIARTYRNARFGNEPPPSIPDGIPTG